MKAKDLAEQLMKYPEAEVVIARVDKEGNALEGLHRQIQLLLPWSVQRMWSAEGIEAVIVGVGGGRRGVGG